MPAMLHEQLRAAGEFFLQPFVLSETNEDLDYFAELKQLRRDQQPLY